MLTRPHALASFGTDWSLGPLHGNRAVNVFNKPENLANESKVLNSLTVVAGEGENLLSQQLGPGLPFPIMRGDHSVPNWSAYLPHAQNFFYDGERAIHDESYQASSAASRASAAGLPQPSSPAASWPAPSPPDPNPGTGL